MTHTPVFIFGALRSGTTLFRLMLNSHGGLHNPGEADFLFDFLHPNPSKPSGWYYDREDMARHRIFRAHDLTLPDDKDGLDLLHELLAQLSSKNAGRPTLNVHRHAEKIIEALPEARFIHLLRDPRDVARSSIGMGWAGNSYYGAGHWITTESGWAAADIDADRVLEVHFEKLMSEIEPQLIRVCNFLGVQFSAEMLEYHKNTTYGPPDPAIAQQWRRKASAHEIALIEGRLGPLLSDCGYTPNGASVVPGRIEKAWLFAQNRIGRWRFNIRRYGLSLFLAAHLSRLLGLKSVYQRVRLRMDAQAIKTLK